MIDPLFPKQADAIRDNDRFQCWNCSRRSGKTQAAARKIIKTNTENSNVSGLYFALTGQSAKEILWDEIIELCDKNKVPIKPNISERTIYFKDTNSRLKLTGADSSEREMKKVLGRKLKFVFIDEAGSFTIDMHKFVYQMIRPTLIDLRGTLVMLGTCETIPNTFFQKCIEGREAGWKTHKWTAYDNPYMAKQWDEEIKLILEKNPLAINAAWFRTHYLNEWMTDKEKLIMKLSTYNFIDQLPDWKDKNYIIGVDLGFNDASAFSVISYSFKNEKAVIEFCDKSKEMDITDVANEIKSILSIYPALSIVIDGANKQAVEEIKKRHGLHVEAAEKTEKASFLMLLRDDLITGNVVLHRPNTQKLVTEWESLIWKDEYKDAEDERCENHISDSVLYAWRKCHHYLYRPDNKKHNQNTDEFMQNHWDKEAEKLKGKEDKPDYSWIGVEDDQDEL